MKKIFLISSTILLSFCGTKKNIISQEKNIEINILSASDKYIFLRKKSKDLTKYSWGKKEKKIVLIISVNIIFLKWLMPI